MYSQIARKRYSGEIHLPARRFLGQQFLLGEVLEVTENRSVEH
jgi:hypothetical protein